MNLRRPRLSSGFVLGGRYRIIKPVGSGGMGTVYLAEDLKLNGKKWAIKEAKLVAEQMSDWDFEAKLLMQFNHPHLPRIVDIFELDGYCYLAMDFIEGKTLQELFEEKKGKLPRPFVMKVILQLCDLLHFLHTFSPRPIIHRDLKPANIMIDAHHHIQLIDFGSARSFKAGQLADTLQLGTVGFASPEQLKGKQTDPRSDLFSLGALIFYLFSGGQYFHAVRRPLREFRPDLPDRFCRLVDRLLEENPEDRYSTALEVKQEILSIPWNRPEYTASSRDMAYPSEKETNFETRRIVFGSFYPGAGSTFVAFAAARMLHALKVPHALIEFPTNLPEMYHLLHGEKNAPSRYRFLADEIMENSFSSQRNTWVEGFTEWFPLNPEGDYSGWTEEHSFRLFFYLKKPFVLVDVSHRMDEPAVRQICRDADELILVVDPLPGKLSQKQLESKLQWLWKMAEEKKTVHFIANRETKKGAKRGWYRDLPFKVVCTCPNLPYEEVINAFRKGKLIFDTNNVRHILLNEFSGLIQNWLPDGQIRIRRILGRTSLFKRFHPRIRFGKNENRVDF